MLLKIELLKVVSYLYVFIVKYLLIVMTKVERKVKRSKFYLEEKYVKNRRICIDFVKLYLIVSMIKY
ncbi:hypothetical protein CAPN010_21460 [Capnocytophaga cynodegmi]|nr:hypothetical protein CAPN010_21460 [Capnocytophaga cynodegmi]